MLCKEIRCVAVVCAGGVPVDKVSTGSIQTSIEFSIRIERFCYDGLILLDHSRQRVREVIGVDTILAATTITIQVYSVGHLRRYAIFQLLHGGLMDVVLEDFVAFINTDPNQKLVNLQQFRMIAST